MPKGEEFVLSLRRYYFDEFMMLVLMLSIYCIFDFLNAGCDEDRGFFTLPKEIQYTIILEAAFNDSENVVLDVVNNKASNVECYSPEKIQQIADNVQKIAILNKSFSHVIKNFKSATHSSLNNLTLVQFFLLIQKQQKQRIVFANAPFERYLFQFSVDDPNAGAKLLRAINDNECFKMLLEHKLCDVDAQLPDCNFPIYGKSYQFSGWTPLLEACRFYPQEIPFLLKNGANINQQDDYGLTPLMHSVMSGDDQRVQLLINEGANLNIQDMNGDTALMHAVKYYYEHPYYSVKMINCDLINKSDMKIKNLADQTALALAYRAFNLWDPVLSQIAKRSTSRDRRIEFFKIKHLSKIVSQAVRIIQITPAMVLVSPALAGYAIYLAIDKTIKKIKGNDVAEE